jgi:hypothetical protein
MYRTASLLFFYNGETLGLCIPIRVVFSFIVLNCWSSHGRTGTMSFSSVQLGKATLHLHAHLFPYLKEDASLVALVSLVFLTKTLRFLA